MDRLKLWDIETRMKQILTQLDITNFNQEISELSGGQLKRVALANVLLAEPDLLILDEPTNHLDLNVIEWLESYLLKSASTLLMVTHDRYFLDRVCSKIFEIDNRNFYQYQGNYSKFAEAREQRLSLEHTEKEKAQNLLRKEEDWMKRMPKARGTKAKYRIDSYYRLKDIAGKRRDDKQMTLNVEAPRMGTKVMVARNIDFRWNGRYYIRNFSYNFSRFEKIGIIGANGTGKTTLLQILTGNLKPENGTLETGDTIKTGYFRQEGMQFDNNMKVLDAVTSIAEAITMADGNTISTSQFLSYFLFPPQRQHDYIYKLSGGEKRRLYLCQVLMQKPNFLVLDEPTNDFDIMSLQVLEDYLKTFNGCVLIVSHDRYFMDNVVDHLFILDGSGLIKDFPGNYAIYSSSQKKAVIEEPGTKEKKVKTSAAPARNKLNFNEKRELQAIEKEISELEAEKKNIEQLLASGTLRQEELQKNSERFGEILMRLDVISSRWMELSEKES